jgi:hypothetical protein
MNDLNVKSASNRNEGTNKSDSFLYEYIGPKILNTFRKSKFSMMKTFLLIVHLEWWNQQSANYFGTFTVFRWFGSARLFFFQIPEQSDNNAQNTQWLHSWQICAEVFGSWSYSLKFGDNICLIENKVGILTVGACKCLQRDWFVT